MKHDIRGKKAKSRMESMRLILESTPSDGELQMKADAIGEELQAIDQALAGEGTYLGIVDKTKLEGRQDLLESKCRLVKEERVLLRSIRVALAEEQRAAAEQAAQQAPSPEARAKNNNRAKAAAVVDSPGSSVVTTSSTATSTSIYRFAADRGIDEFLKANAGLGLPAGSGAATAAAGVKATTPFPERDAHNDDDDDEDDNDVTNVTVV